jgi:hypothetical protein
MHGRQGLRRPQCLLAIVASGDRKAFRAQESAQVLGEVGAVDDGQEADGLRYGPGSGVPRQAELHACAVIRNAPSRGRHAAWRSLHQRQPEADTERLGAKPGLEHPPL